MKPLYFGPDVRWLFLLGTFGRANTGGIASKQKVNHSWYFVFFFYMIHACTVPFADQ